MQAPRPDRIDWRDLAILPYVALCLCFIHYRPIWDGMEYWRCTVEVAAYPFNPFRYDCFGHPTLGYIIPVGLSQRFTGPNYAAIVIANTLLGTLGILAFSRILNRLVPGDGWRVERVIATVCMSLFPVYTACTIQLTPDFGMAIYALCLALSLIENRLRMAVFFGILVSLCKETGLPVFLSISGAWLVHFVLRVEDPDKTPIERLRSKALLLVVPLTVVADMIGRRWVRGPGRSWGGRGLEIPIWKQLITVDFLDAVLPTQLWELVGINFLWILTIFVVLDALQSLSRGLWDWACGTAPRPATDSERVARTLALSFVGIAFFLTRFRTYAMPRYQLPGVPFVILLGVRAFWNLEVAPRPRRLMLSLVALLFAVSNFSTRDGLSIKLFDTLPFGRHRLLDLTANTHECCRTDQLVYNLEFTQIDYLLTRALPVIFARGVEPLGFPGFAAGNVVDRVRRADRRRATQRDDTLEVQKVMLDDHSVPSPLVPSLWFLGLPELDEDELVLWRRWYDFGAPQTFSRFGYELKVIPMRLRARLPVGLPP